MARQSLEQQLVIGQGLELVSKSYGELASMKIARIRARVLRNRQFFDRLIKVYAQVKKEAVNKGVELKNNGRVIHLLICSNQRFYGTINHKTVKAFAQNYYNFMGDVILIGSRGVEEMKAYPRVKYSLFNIKNDLPKPIELDKLAKIISKYAQVLIYFVEMSTILDQRVVVRDITASYNVQLNQISTIQSKTDYILEPEISNILDFFDNQVFLLLLEQAFLEAELSREASRLVVMTDATDKAKISIKHTQELILKDKKRSNNKRQLEAISSLLLN